MTKPAKKTPLYEKHASQEAIFETYGGFSLPKSYGDSHLEAKTARKSVSVTDISDRAKLLVSGADHLKFLQGVLTNDVKKKIPGTGNYAAILTPKGKMISDMRIFKNKDSVYIDMEPAMSEDIAQLFRKLKLSYKADVVDLTEDYCLLHVCGPDCEKFIGKRFHFNPEDMNEYDHTGIGKATFFKLNRTGKTGFDILFTNEDAREIWKHFAEVSSDIALFGHDAMEILRIEAGIPVYGKDMDTSTIPIEAGIWDALDFEKGCYVGQEVIARIKWRGRVNWHLAHFVSERNGIALPGDTLEIEEKKVGRITSSAYSPNLEKNISIGYIRREFQDFQGKIRVKSGEREDEIPNAVKIKKNLLSSLPNS